MAWVCWIVSMSLLVVEATVEASIWMLMAFINWGVRDIIAAIHKGSN